MKQDTEFGFDGFDKTFAPVINLNAQ